MMCGFINYLSEGRAAAEGKAAIFPGFVNPGDMREYRRIVDLMGMPCVIFPDTSGVMDAPMTGNYIMYPRGGTSLDDVRGLGSCSRTIALGEFTSEAPAIALERKCGVEYDLLPLPIGIEATDGFLMALARAYSRDVPYELEEERGQLLDVILDSHFYLFGKKAAIYGDPDTVLGLTSLALEIGMVPKYVITGTPGDGFVKRAEEMFAAYGAEGCMAKAPADLLELHQLIMDDPVDILVGTSYGKQIAKAEDIPLVRVGFPILDRYAHSAFPIIGYRGALRLVEKITDAIMDRMDRDASDEDLELVM
jgi:nitrogenase molybdenum-iron protein beta chain